MRLLQAGGVSVIADNDKVKFNPSTLLYARTWDLWTVDLWTVSSTLLHGRTWTCGLLGGYKKEKQICGLDDKPNKSVRLG